MSGYQKKRGNQKNKKKQQYLQNKRKKSNKTNVKHTTKKQENKTNCEGRIKIFNSTYVGVLRGYLIYLYTRHVSSTTIPYDIIDLSHYFSVDKFRYGLDSVGLDSVGLELFTECSQPCAKKGTCNPNHLYILFEIESNYQQWYNMISKTLQLVNTIKKNTIKQNDNDFNIIHNGRG
eukprot:237913_1